ncbi:MAG TPA: hypothetical protein VMU81_21070 [Acetobacteraceae bacterium]|nr:hypothetical protein [Acetobacteraceae bacterium]
MDANAWAAVAAGCSAIAATVSLVVAWHAKRIQGRSADFANCVDVIERLGCAMRRVRDATEEHYRFEFIELLNLLEALAMLHNDGKIAPSTKRITRKFLDECLAWIRSDEGMKQLMADSVTGDETYMELKAFEQRRHREIARQAKSYAIQKGLR